MMTRETYIFDTFLFKFRSERFLRRAANEKDQLRRARLDEEQVPGPEHRCAQRGQGLRQSASTQRGLRADLPQRLRQVDPDGALDRARWRHEHHLRPYRLPSQHRVPYQAVLRRQTQQNHVPDPRAWR